MSKKKINEGISIDTTMKDDALYWDGLIEMREDLLKSIFVQNSIILELVQTHEAAINASKEIYEQSDGLIKSIQDINKDVELISAKHTLNGELRRGIIDTSTNDPEKYLYIGTEYVNLTETLSNLMSTAYLDIFTKLKISTAGVKDAIDQGNAAVNDIVEEIGNGK